MIVIFKLEIGTRIIKKRIAKKIIILSYSDLQIVKAQKSLKKTKPQATETSKQ